MGPASANETHLQHLGRFVAALRWEALPEATRRAARYHLLDMLAAVYAAARAPEPASVLKGARAAHPEPGPSTIFATGERAPVTVAASVNAAYAMAHDFDDIIWMGHTCHSAVFASLAVAEQRGATSEALLTAIVAANEVSGRLVASCFFGPLNGQMTTYVHAIGAAAATASLLGLDATATTHALAIALAQPNFALQPAFMLPTSKLLSASVPLTTGIEAAYFAQHGLTGDPALLEDPRGFWTHFAFVPLPAMLGELGEFWAIQTLTMKSYPGCHYFQTACTALERIAARRALTPESVRRVEVWTNKLTCETARFGAAYASGPGAPLSPVNVNFDLAATLAVLLHAGRLTTAELDATWLTAHTPAIAAWQARIDVHHDPALTLAVIDSARALPAGRAGLRSLSARDLLTVRRRYREAYASELIRLPEAGRWAQALARRALAGAPTPSDHGSAAPLAFPSRVTVHFHDGTQHTEALDIPTGSFALPSAEAILCAKFRSNAAGVLRDPERALLEGLALERQPLSQWLARLAPR